MVVCDGFNVPATATTTTTNSAPLPPTTASNMPFPTSTSTTSIPPVPLPKPQLNSLNNGGDRVDFSAANGVKRLPPAQCNYDNLRDIEGSTDDYTTVEKITAATASNGVRPSMPITDKSLMNNIMNKSAADPKSQSMFASNTNQANNTANSVSHLN